MDEPELEARLRARLHVRFDGAAAPARLRDAVAADLTASNQPHGRRFVPAGWSRQLLAIAAVVVAVVVVAVTLRFSMLPGEVGPGGSASGSPGPTASPSASVAPSGSPAPTVPQPTVPPASTIAWTALDVATLSGAPVQASAVVPWSGGYLAWGQATADGSAQLWRSTDGRSWTVEVPTVTPAGSSLGEVQSGTACGDRVILITFDSASASDQAWSSADGTTWQRMSGADATFDVAGGPSGAIMALDSGPKIAFSADCTAWQTETLPGPANLSVGAVAPSGSGFVAAGYSGQTESNDVRPLAWWSADGVDWNAATVQAKPGDGFVQLYAARDGLIAVSTEPGVTPGLSSLWTSADGRRWQADQADPLGTIAAGEGVGSLASSFSGDGTRLLAYGTRNDAAGPIEYWTSFDGSHWTQLSLGGANASTMLADSEARPFLMRDGVLVSGTSASWFGAARAP